MSIRIKIKIKIKSKIKSERTCRSWPKAVNGYEIRRHWRGVVAVGSDFLGAAYMGDV